MITSYTVHLTGPNWTKSEVDKVLVTLREIYEGNSDKAKALMNRAPDRLFIFNSETTNFGTDGMAPFYPFQTIGVNLKTPDQLAYMSLDGNFRFMSLKRALIHELHHAIDQIHDLKDPDTGNVYPDNNPRSYNHANFDHLGATVQATNKVMVELGDPVGAGRAGYDATFVQNQFGNTEMNPFQLDLRFSLDYAPWVDVDFAFGERILDGVPLNSNPNVLDTSYRETELNNLLFGFAEDDVMWAGEGVDYLYGGKGDDRLFGGSGQDLLHGGDGKTPLADDSTDIADYYDGDAGELTPSGITIQFDLTSGEKFDAPEYMGKHPVWVSDDGYGDSDYLYSIERLEGTAHDDTVEVHGGEEIFDESNYALSDGSLEIDGGEGEDILDFTNYSGDLDLGNIFDAILHDDLGVGDVTFKNFEVIKDSDSTGKVGGGIFLDLVRPDTTNTGLGALVPLIGTLLDINYYPDGIKEIYGNGGNDYLVVGPDGRTVEGGAGHDLLLGRHATFVPASPSGVTPVTPEERLTLDGGTGSDWVIARGGTGAITVGGAGSDFIYNNSFKGQLYGDSIDGTGGGDPDVFWWSSNSFIMDAEEHDILQMFGVPLTGGSNSLYGAVANFGSTVRDFVLPFVTYGATPSGQLLIMTPWADGPMVVEKYDYGKFRDTTLGIPERGDLGMVFRIVGGEDLEVKLFITVWGHIATFITALWTFAKGLQWKAADDPLVLDLDGDGIETSTFDQGGVYFDMDNDYFSELTGWVGADDGLLVWDQDGNRRIDDSTELFGSLGTGGFTELAALDDNADGVIDANDATFSDLEVWRDLNQDGRTDDGELFALVCMRLAA